MGRGCHRPATYLDYGSAGQAEVGDSDDVDLETVEVILHVLLAAGELQELALVACLHRVLEKVAQVLVHV